MEYMNLPSALGTNKQDFRTEHKFRLKKTKTTLVLDLLFLATTQATGWSSGMFNNQC